MAPRQAVLCFLNSRFFVVNSTEKSVQVLADPLIFVTSDRQPDFVIESVEPTYPSPTATLPSAVVVTIANQGVTPTAPLCPSKLP